MVNNYTHMNRVRETESELVDAHKGVRNKGRKGRLIVNGG